MSKLELQNIKKDYPEFSLDLNLSVNEGEFLTIIGPSGSGKSTLLNIIAGLDSPAHGSILLDGRDITSTPPQKRGISMVFQDYALFPSMNVEKNIAWAMKIRKVKASERHSAADQLLSLVNLSGYGKRKVTTLSGGEAQRVALARALSSDPSILLLDEPMGALDKKLREQMRLELVDIINSVGVTCLMVTHDQEEAMTMADRIAIMDRGEFIQIGGPREIYENPNCRFCAEFIGSVNIFECSLVTSSANQALIKARDFNHLIELSHDVDLADGMPLIIALRPEKLYIAHERPEENTNWCEGVVENIAYLGDISIYYVKLSNGRIITSTLPNVDRFKQGLPTWDDHVYLSWDPDSCIALTI